MFWILGIVLWRDYTKHFNPCEHIFYQGKDRVQIINIINLKIDYYRRHRCSGGKKNGDKNSRAFFNEVDR